MLDVFGDSSGANTVDSHARLSQGKVGGCTRKLVDIDANKIQRSNISFILSAHGAPTKTNPVCLPLRHSLLTTPGAPGGSPPAAGVVVALPTVLCTFGEGAGEPVIEGGVVVVDV